MSSSDVQVLNPKKSSCGRYALRNTKTGEFWPALCRGRACRRDVCREKYAARTVREIAAIERLNGFDTMVTLTLDPKKYPDPAVAWLDITRVWHNLCRELRRIYHKLPFVWCLEKTPSNPYPHIHFSTSQFIPVNQDWCRNGERPLSELWDMVGGGCVVDARFIVGGVAQYIGKGFTKEAVKQGVSSYITKDFLSIGDYVEKGSRIWGCSQGLKRLEKKTNPEIQFVHGISVFDENLETDLTSDDLEGMMEFGEYHRGLSDWVKAQAWKANFFRRSVEYDKRQSRENLARPCQSSPKTCEQVMASNEGQQARQGQARQATFTT